MDWTQAEIAALLAGLKNGLCLTAVRVDRQYLLHQVGLKVLFSQNSLTGKMLTNYIGTCIASLDARPAPVVTTETALSVAFTA